MTPELVLYEKLKYHVKVGPDGRRSYYNGAGQLHRDDGPAIIDSDGVEYWFQNDKQHRVGGPAVVHPAVLNFGCNTTCYTVKMALRLNMQMATKSGGSTAKVTLSRNIKHSSNYRNTHAYSSRTIQCTEISY